MTHQTLSDLHGETRVATEQIPRSLREAPQWVCWKSEDRQGRSTKIPYDARTGRRASSTDPATWTTYEQAIGTFEQAPDLDGIGFVFTRTDPFCGVDLDDCIDENGVFEPWAKQIIDRFSTYTEVSPSGRGVKLFLRGELPRRGNRKGRIEIYDHARYFTVTSRRLSESPTEIAERQEELDELHAELFGRPEEGGGRGPSEASRYPLEISDDELLVKARAAKNGPKLTALFDHGDLSEYGGDDSAADLALCSLLAFWCGPDPRRIDRLFRRSALIRPKWDSPRGGGTYGSRTISRALEGTSPYQPETGGIRTPRSRDPHGVIAELEALEDEVELAQIEPLLRELGQALRGADDLRVCVQREAAIKALQGKVTGPARLVDAALAHEPRAREEPAPGRALAFDDPEPWPHPVDGAELLRDIEAVFRRFTIMEEPAFTVLALWILHTYVFDVAWITPRLAITSPEKRCGKTLVLTLLNRLVAKPLMSANASPAAIFRCVDQVRPTLLIDEGDTFLHGKDELRGILNSGHQQDGGVLRTVGDDHETRSFSTFSPCAIAMIGKLPDTLEDRSVSVRMARKLPGEQVERLRMDRLAALEKLRRRAVRWAGDTRELLTRADPEAPEELHDRAADNWRSLLALADVAGGEWPQRSRAAARTGSSAGGEDSSVRIRLLEDLRSLLVAGGGRMFTQDILAELHEMEERPWPEWKAGKPLSTRQLAKLLEPFGIKPLQIRIGNQSRKGYRLDDCRDAFERYLPVSNRNIRNIPMESETYGNCGSETRRVAVSGGYGLENPGSMRVVSDVSDRDGGSEASGPLVPKEVMEL